MKIRHKSRYDEANPQAVIAKAAEGTLVESDDSTATFVLSNSDVDRYGDVIDQKGWKLDNYKANPIVLFGHDATKVENVMGTMENIQNDGKALVGTVRFADPGVNPNADIVRKLVAAGILRTVSVGFKPLKAKAASDVQRKGGWDFQEQELLEVSIVPVPALPTALAKSAELGIDMRALVKSGLIETPPAFAVKGYWEIGWLASLLEDGKWVHGWLENDDVGKDTLLAGLQAIGQALVEMSQEALDDLLALGAPETVENGFSLAAPSPMELALRQFAMAKKDLVGALSLDNVRKAHLEGKTVRFSVDKAAPQAVTPPVGLSDETKTQLISAKSVLTEGLEMVEKILSQGGVPSQQQTQPTEQRSGSTETEGEALRRRQAIAAKKRAAFSTSAN